MSRWSGLGVGERVAGLARRTRAIGMWPGSERVIRPLAEGAEGGFPGTTDGAWYLFSSS